MKYQALKLRNNKQIPYYLAKCINDLTGEENTTYVRWLIEMSKHYLRLKNYYKEYPEADEEAERQLKEARLKLGF